MVLRKKFSKHASRHKTDGKSKIDLTKEIQGVKYGFCKINFIKKMGLA